MSDIQITDLGFYLLNFEDALGNKSSAQSSKFCLKLAKNARELEELAEPVLWLGHDHDRMCLDRAGVLALISVLSNWYDHGTFQGKDDGSCSKPGEPSSPATAAGS